MRRLSARNIGRLSGFLRTAFPEFRVFCEFQLAISQFPNAKTRHAWLRTGFQAKQFTLNKTSWLTGPVKRVSNFFSTWGGAGWSRGAKNEIDRSVSYRILLALMVPVADIVLPEKMGLTTI
jgi:hypothetical protein